ncbi:cryptic protein [Pogona vitticeps]
MRWRQNARFIFTLILALQDVPLGKGYKKEMERGHTGENDDARAPKHHPKDQTTTLNVFKAMNQSYESRKHMNFKPVVPFTGLTQSRTLNRHCCQNGGTCILGSFCACPKHFIGRYCEYDERKSGCGPFKHGEWIQKACRLCRCGFGVFHCLSQPIQNCAGRKEEEFIHLPSNCPGLQQTMCFLMLLLVAFLVLFCSKPFHQL